MAKFSLQNLIDSLGGASTLSALLIAGVTKLYESYLTAHKSVAESGLVDVALLDASVARALLQFNGVDTDPLGKIDLSGNPIINLPVTGGPDTNIPPVTPDPLKVYATQPPALAGFTVYRRDDGLFVYQPNGVGPVPPTWVRM